MQSERGPCGSGSVGAVGAGKTTLTEKLCRAMAGEIFRRGHQPNDIYTSEDAEFLLRAQALPAERIRGGGNGRLSAYRDPRGCLDPTSLRWRSSGARIPDLDVIFIESGGDNLAATSSPELADLTLYVIDTAAGQGHPAQEGAGGHAVRFPDREQGRISRPMWGSTRPCSRQTQPRRGRGVPSVMASPAQRGRRGGGRGLSEAGRRGYDGGVRRELRGKLGDNGPPPVTSAA